MGEMIISAIGRKVRLQNLVCFHVVQQWTHLPEFKVARILQGHIASNQISEVVHFWQLQHSELIIAQLRCDLYQCMTYFSNAGLMDITHYYIADPVSYEKVWV